jgi:hypothetical protein
VRANVRANVRTCVRHSAAVVAGAARPGSAACVAAGTSYRLGYPMCGVKSRLGAPARARGPLGDVPGGARRESRLRPTGQAAAGRRLVLMEATGLRSPRTKTRAAAVELVHTEPPWPRAHSSPSGPLQMELGTLGITPKGDAAAAANLPYRSASTASASASERECRA